MALDYRRETKNKNLQLIENLLDKLPLFVTDFIKENEITKSDNTLLSYTRDIQSFFDYLTSPQGVFQGIEINDITTTQLNTLSTSHIKSYERFMGKLNNLSNTTIKRRLSSVASLYKHLISSSKVTNNPLLHYSYPKAENHGITYLNSEQTKMLLDGVMSNQKKLLGKNTGKYTKEGEPVLELVPVDLTPQEAITKEKNVLRDMAMIILFLGTGLRISELVGIDIDDLDFDENCVTVSRKGKGMSLEKVYFGQEVAESLKMYLHGMELPMEVIKKYDDDFLQFCSLNAYKVNVVELSYDKFKRRDDEFVRDIEQICYIIRNYGRSNFNPKRGEGALFLSSRGTRISVRMVEMIIKEKVLCYLPDLKNKDKISPHKLRSTAATRLLSQTDDILLVSKQLGHSSPTVTAKHYAQLQEEKEKVRLAALDITDW